MSEPQTYAVLPLRDIVVFPTMVSISPPGERLNSVRQKTRMSETIEVSEIWSIISKWDELKR